MKKIVFVFVMILMQISLSQAKEQNKICKSGYIFKYLRDTRQGKVIKAPVYNVEIKFNELCKSEEVFDDGEIVEKLYQYCNKEVDNWVEGNNHSTMMRAMAKGTSQAEEKSRLKDSQDNLCVNLKIAMSVYRKENGASGGCEDSLKDSINNLKRSAKEMEGHVKSAPGKSAVATPK